MRLLMNVQCLISTGRQRKSILVQYILRSLSRFYFRSVCGENSCYSLDSVSPRWVMGKYFPQGAGNPPPRSYGIIIYCRGSRQLW